MNKNTLAVVGVGIKSMSHITKEAQACIESADKVLYLVNEPATKLWIQSLNINSESLDSLYKQFQNRDDNYKSISDYIIKILADTELLCLVIYGHPTVLVKPSLYAINTALKNKYKVIVMPGISSEDCLFADLCIDPSSSGYASFEATDFLIYEREFDLSSHLILWQPYVIGKKGLLENHNSFFGLNLLKECLLKKYPSDHQIILYEAAQYPTFKPKIDKIFLSDLPISSVTRLTTLYIPPFLNKKSNPAICKLLKENI